MVTVILQTVLSPWLRKRTVDLQINYVCISFFRRLSFDMAKRPFEAVVWKQETTVKGGMMSKPCSLPTLTVKIGDNDMEFVQLNKRQDWTSFKTSQAA